MAALDALVLVMGVLFYNQITAVCFDEEFARVRGVNVEFYYILLLTLTALTVVILTNVVGIILLIALLTLPAATAGQFTKSLGKNMVLATVLTIVIMTIGLAASFGPNLPAGATMIIVAGIVYLVALVIARARRRMAA
jgi:zinc transport system permease protein